MVNSFVITGGKQLRGTVDVRGSKNAALPILAATILTKEICRISNLPLVLDVHRMLKMLEDMGSSIRWDGSHTVVIENKDIRPARLGKDTVKKMRASILLLGPLLARFGRVEKMTYPGGCSIGARPIDTHLAAFRDLGAKVTLGGKYFSVEIPPHRRMPPEVILNEFSVTATENLLLFLASKGSTTRIKIAACEPHVRDLAKCLAKMGARSRGAGTSTITIRGTDRLGGISHRTTPDYIEAGTFILASLAVGGHVHIKDAPVVDLDFVIKKLVSAGADIRVHPNKKLVEVRASFGGAGKGGRKLKIDKIQCLPHPGIPTDLQPAFGVLATQVSGPTLIHEPLYEKRLESLTELTKMGARVVVQDPHRAIVHGPTKLHGARLTCYDLRSGAALAIAGLAGKGKTIITNIEHLERGYEDLEGRLRALGADIKKI